MPTLRACTIMFSPSASRTVSFTGQTGSQGALPLADMVDAGNRRRSRLL
ncbi:hypothetical protein ACFQY5_18500 [Paeniroseomonas aquatica]